jgi:S-adenosylmethionine-diacylgycerolhomoserine-N-methlytransferase
MSESGVSGVRETATEGLGLDSIAGFYSWQAPIYDLTRPLLLFGRGRVVSELETGPGQLALDVGCGTGWSLGRLHAAGAGVIGIECTHAMRARAADRLARMGLRESIRLDERPYGSHDDYRGRADRILFSYSLSMMPPFRDILEQARRDLRPGGRIGVVDFLDAAPPVAGLLERSHVHLGAQRLEELERQFPDHRLEQRSVGIWRYFLFWGRSPG